jgi:hypothetical protein
MAQHRGDPFQRLDGPDQHGTPRSTFFRDHVAAMMHSVCEIDVEMPAVSEHHGIPSGNSPVGVAGRVAAAQVCLCFDDSTDEEALRQSPDKVTPDEIACHRQGAAAIE